MTPSLVLPETNTDCEVYEKEEENSFDTNRGFNRMSSIQKLLLKSRDRAKQNWIKLFDIVLTKNMKKVTKDDIEQDNKNGGKELLNGRQDEGTETKYQPELHVEQTLKVSSSFAKTKSAQSLRKAMPSTGRKSLKRSKSTGHGIGHEANTARGKYSSCRGSVENLWLVGSLQSFHIQVIRRTV